MSSVPAKSWRRSSDTTPRPHRQGVIRSGTCCESRVQGGSACSRRTGLGVKGSLKQTLQSTNPCESMIEIVRRTSRNVKRWQSGDMCLRWTAAGMLDAERQFRKIIGYSDLAKLATRVERDLAAHCITASITTCEEAVTLVIA